MTQLTDLTIADALGKLKSKEISASELVGAHIAAAESARNLNCFITETFEQAEAQAKDSDARYAKGEALALDGIPIAMKDLFCTTGVRTTAASKILENFIPPYESTVSGKLLSAGTISLGKANLDEFAMGSSTTTSAYGNTLNPWKRNGDDADLVPGGSSGGSSAAVAARIVMGATGTDTGGSIRQPASLCGIAGIKPTYGRCSRFGVVAFASSLDQAGVFARDTRDCALLLQHAAGFDPHDSTSADLPVPDFSALLGQGLKGKRIGIPKEYRIDGINQEISDLWDQGAKWMREAGAEIVDISLPHTKYALPVYYIIAPAEASSNLARYDGMRYGLRVEGDNLKDTYRKTRAAGFGSEVKRRLMIGAYVLSAGYYDAYYVKAQQIRRLIRQDFLDAFEKCDAILTPSTPSVAFAIGENEDDPLQMYLNDIFTVSINLAGLPGMSVPAGLDKQGLPLGLQIIGKPWDEQGVLQACHAIETAAKFTAKPRTVTAKAA